MFVLSLVLLASLLLGSEAIRQPFGKIDCLRATAIVYALAFIVVPSYLYMYGATAADLGWGWLTPSPSAAEMVGYAAILSCFAYGALLGGYALAGLLLAGRGVRKRSPMPAQLSQRATVAVGLILSVIGIVAFGYYSYHHGGLLITLEQSMSFRSRSGDVALAEVGFLKNVALLTLSGSLFLWAASRHHTREGTSHHLVHVAAVASVAASVIILFHHAGRLGLLAYVLAFPLSNALKRDSLPTLTTMIAAIVATPLFLMGKQLFNAIMFPDGFAFQWEFLSSSPWRPLHVLMLECAFPYATLTNAMDVIPDQVPYRWFMDFPLAFGYLLPDRYFPLSLPPTASMINTELLGGAGIPVDLLSFGYFSAGVCGVAVTTASFGGVLRFAETLFTGDPRCELKHLLRATWILFMAFRVMYGDPAHWFVSGFHVFMATGAVLLLQAAPTFRVRARANGDHICA